MIIPAGCTFTITLFMPIKLGCRPPAGRVIMDWAMRTQGDHRESKYKDFLALLLEHKSSIYAYVLALRPRTSTASDIMQETVMVMWEKFDQFTPGTSFTAWGKAIAYNKVRSFRRNDEKMLCFDDDVLAMLASEPQPEDRAPRIEMLHQCTKRLSKTDSRLLHLRFRDEMKINRIAEIWGKPTHTVYRRMSQILFFLRECIEKNLALPEAD